MLIVCSKCIIGNKINFSCWKPWAKFARRWLWRPKCLRHRTWVPSICMVSVWLWSVWAWKIVKLVAQSNQTLIGKITCDFPSHRRIVFWRSKKVDVLLLCFECISSVGVANYLDVCSVAATPRDNKRFHDDLNKIFAFTKEFVSPVEEGTRDVPPIFCHSRSPNNRLNLNCAFNFSNRVECFF